MRVLPARALTSQPSTNSRLLCTSRTGTRSCGAPCPSSEGLVDDEVIGAEIDSRRLALDRVRSGFCCSPRKLMPSLPLLAEDAYAARRGEGESPSLMRRSSFCPQEEADGARAVLVRAHAIDDVGFYVHCGRLHRFACASTSRCGWSRGPSTVNMKYSLTPFLDDALLDALGQAALRTSS